ncbi:VOC family protein [Galbibacter sp. EGI 63066]|uniref:VOC family protein n=1 Tax=Galbibacter sp. EGI 63066 TaxID=2993559 RepID=UPI00224948AC|nr:VOC family protein [Galbibacter sp. EGI 63066]MCX2681566.1 VOC family protein [Galbibacter sp. EGI 63066]
MKYNPVVWFEIYADDLERAQKFYEKVLDLKLDELPMPEPMEGENKMEMLAFPMDMEATGAGGTLVKMDGVKAGGNSTLVYFGSEDCSVEESRIEKAGGKVLQTKQSLGEYGFMILANDTEGNMFGVHSLK